MQQTEKYQLNLIEPSDPFLPDGLNQNTQKIENVLHAALTGEAAARTAADTDLDARLQVFEAKKFAYGTYNNPGSTPVTIMLGFTPKVVCVYWLNENAGMTSVVVEDAPRAGDYLYIIEGGFESDLHGGVLYSGRYTYFAFG